MTWELDMTAEEKETRRKAIGWPHGCACGERFTTAALQDREDEAAWRAR